MIRDEYDPTGPVVARAVEEVFRRTGQVWHLTVGGRLVRTSGEHPFYAWDRGWVGCNELKVGDLPAAGVDHLLDRPPGPVLAQQRVVYNLRVADHHTYFVGKDEWGFAL